MEPLGHASKDWLNILERRLTQALVFIFGILMVYLVLAPMSPKRRRRFAGDKVFRIWQDPAPFSKGRDDPSYPLPHSHHPSLEVFLPASVATSKVQKRPAMIILPGGGYEFLSEYEAEPPAEWFKEHNIVAFVLRYRVGPEYQYPVQVN